MRITDITPAVLVAAAWLEHRDTRPDTAKVAEDPFELVTGGFLRDMTPDIETTTGETA